MVAFFRVELDREASDIADCVCTAPLTTSGAEAEENTRFLADSAKELGAGQLRNYLVGDFKFTPGTRCFSMNNPVYE